MKVEEHLLESLFVMAEVVEARDPYAGYESSAALYFSVAAADARFHPETKGYQAGR